MLLGLPFALFACADDAPSPAPRPDAPRPVADVIADHAPRLLAIPGVTMVSESADDAGRPFIRIGVLSLDDALRTKLPAELEGWRVEIEETGEVRPLGE